MKQDGSIALFQYWNGLRAGRTAPLHTEIEPAAIKSVLADTFILERRPRGHAAFRLAGTRACAVYGRELRGVSFASLWEAEDRHQVDRVVESVFGGNKVVSVCFEGATRGRRSTPFEMIVLPLDGASSGSSIGAAGQMPRCIGLLASLDKPFWLGADPIVTGRIASVGVVDPTQHGSPTGRAAIEVPALSPIELPSGEPLGPAATRRVRHLVVHDGGRVE